MTFPNITSITGASTKPALLTKHPGKAKRSKNQSKEILELKRQIEISKMAITSAQNQFEHVVDPTLIDCYIYELNAAQLRYQFLLRSLKSCEL